MKSIRHMAVVVLAMVDGPHVQSWKPSVRVAVFLLEILRYVTVEFNATRIRLYKAGHPHQSRFAVWGLWFWALGELHLLNNNDRTSNERTFENVPLLYGNQCEAS